MDSQLHKINNDSQLFKHKKDLNGQDKILQSMSEGVKQTLAEFGLFNDHEDSSNQNSQDQFNQRRNSGLHKNSHQNKQSVKYLMDSFQNMQNQKRNKIMSNSMLQCQNTLRNTYDESEELTGSVVSQKQNPKQLKRRLVKVLYSKIEKLKEKQINKRQLKHQLKQQQKEEKNSQQNISTQSQDQLQNNSNKLNPDSKLLQKQIANEPEREILIRLKPLTQASKDFVSKIRKANSLMQFRIKIGGSNDQNKEKIHKQKSVKDIIQIICEKWQLRKSHVELRLCRSAAELVQFDARQLIKFDYKSKIKISQLLKIEDQTAKNLEQSQGEGQTKQQVLYLLYDIKDYKELQGDQNMSSSDDSYYNSSSESQSHENSEDGEDNEDDEESKDSKGDEEENDLADIFTDILSLMVLQKKQKVESPQPTQKTHQRSIEYCQDSMLIPRENLNFKQNAQKQKEKPEEEIRPSFVHGLEYYSQLRSIQSQSSVNANIQNITKPSFQKSGNPIQNQNSMSFDDKVAKFGTKNQQVNKQIQGFQSIMKATDNPENRKNILSNKINSPTGSRKSAFQPISQFEQSLGTTLNEQASSITQGATKITSFKQYFENKKLSSAAPSQCPSLVGPQNEKNSQKEDLSKPLLKSNPIVQQRQAIEKSLHQRSNSQDSISAVDYNNQTDSMQCKEQLSTSNFISLNFGAINKNINQSGQDPSNNQSTGVTQGFKKIMQNQQQQSLRQSNNNKLQVPTPNSKPMFGEDENSMMRNYPFGQNSMNNLLWPTNSNFLPTVSNMVGGFGQPKIPQQHQQQQNLQMSNNYNNRILQSPMQLGEFNQYENSNLFLFSQMLPFNRQNQQPQNNQQPNIEKQQQYNPFTLRTPFINDSNLPFSNQLNLNITPKKLNFHENQQQQSTIYANQQERQVQQNHFNGENRNNKSQENQEQDKTYRNDTETEHDKQNYDKAAVNQKKQLIKDFKITSNDDNNTPDKNENNKKDQQSEEDGVKLDVTDKSKITTKNDNQCKSLPHPDEVFPNSNIIENEENEDKEDQTKNKKATPKKDVKDKKHKLSEKREPQKSEQTNKQSKQDQQEQQQHHQQPQYNPYYMGYPPGFNPQHYIPYPPPHQTFINNNLIQIRNNQMFFENSQQYHQKHSQKDATDRNNPVSSDKKRQSKSQQQSQHIPKSGHQQKQGDNSKQQKKNSQQVNKMQQAMMQHQQMQNQQYLNAQMRTQYFHYYQQVYGPNFNQGAMIPQTNPYFYSLINNGQKEAIQENTIDSNNKEQQQKQSSQSQSQHPMKSRQQTAAQNQETKNTRK